MYKDKQQQREFNLNDYEILSLIIKFFKEDIKVEVFQVKHKQKCQLFALKKIHKPIDEAATQAFFREFELIKSLDHPHIIKLYSYQETDNEIFALYDFMEMNLRKCYKDINNDQSMMIIVQIAEALKYLHSKSVLHRDVNISNILISGSGLQIKAKLIDFQYASSLQSERATETGSLDSLAPEIINEQSQNQMVDVWGLGVIMYILFAKAQPFFVKGEMSYKMTRENIKNCNPKYPEAIPEPIKEILQKILVLNPLFRLTLIDILNHQYFRQTKEKLEQIRQKEHLQRKITILEKALISKKTTQLRSSEVIHLQNKLYKLEDEYRLAQETHQSQKIKLKKTEIECMNLEKQRKKMQQYKMNLEKSKLQLKKINNNIGLVEQENKKIKKKTLELEAELEFMKNNENHQKTSQAHYNEHNKKSITSFNKQLFGNFREKEMELGREMQKQRTRSRNNTRELLPPTMNLTKSTKSIHYYQK